MNRIDRAPYAGAFLSDGDIDANHVGVLLGDDGIDRERGFTNGAIANDQFALATAKREKCINDEQPCLHRLGHKITVNNVRRRALDWIEPVAGNGALAVEWPAQRIDNPAEQVWTNRHAHDIARATHRIACGDHVYAVKKDTSHTVAIQRLHKTESPLIEAHQLGKSDLRQAGDQRDTVRHLLDPTDLLDLWTKFGGGNT